MAKSRYITAEVAILKRLNYKKFMKTMTNCCHDLSVDTGVLTVDYQRKTLLIALKHWTEIKLMTLVEPEGWDTYQRPVYYLTI